MLKYNLMRNIEEVMLLASFQSSLIRKLYASVQFFFNLVPHSVLPVFPKKSFQKEILAKKIIYR